MPNLNQLSNISAAATALSNLILVTPQADVGIQPQNAEISGGSLVAQPPSILFNYEGEQTVTLDSDITDHYIEDNTAINDQIALHPEMITTSGYIGELNDVVPQALAQAKFIANKLVAIGTYVPSLSITAIEAYNDAAMKYAIVQNTRNAAVAAWASVNGGGGVSVINGTSIKQKSNQNKQQVAFQQFYGYWRSRTLFTVQTPWAIFQNVAIKSLRAVQDAETRVITDFEVTFKLLRFANTIVTAGPSNPANFLGRSAAQAADITDLGTQNLTNAQAFSPAITFPTGA